ncbi:hypothetical protein [Streptomyces liliifuscus]|uniref:Uncharacterized protein n=1 Tax=Streptomyces liliifuscus TaxID=2797636 RepID=A0A7T7L2A0_9ACTN|nr:hypothetical protein [Streptomyces liliifuscus]QQM45112.1 hypothetical protein JEQ17_40755 [Streptomyces liliifuscus]
MKRGTGRRRAGADNVRLRQEVATVRADLAWYRNRLMAITARCRALTAQAEITDGERLLDKQLIHRQKTALQQKNQRIAELERLIEVSSEDTQKIPIVTAAEPELAGATT